MKNKIKWRIGVLIIWAVSGYIHLFDSKHGLRYIGSGDLTYIPIPNLLALIIFWTGVLCLLYLLGFFLAGKMFPDD